MRAIRDERSTEYTKLARFDQLDSWSSMDSNRSHDFLYIECIASWVCPSSKNGQTWIRWDLIRSFLFIKFYRDCGFDKMILKFRFNFDTRVFRVNNKLEDYTSNFVMYNRFPFENWYVTRISVVMNDCIISGAILFDSNGQLSVVTYSVYFEFSKLLIFEWIGYNSSKWRQCWTMLENWLALSTYEPLVGFEWRTRNIASARTLIVYLVYLTNEPCHLEISRAR